MVGFSGAESPLKQSQELLAPIISNTNVVCYCFVSFLMIISNFVCGGVKSTSEIDTLIISDQNIRIPYHQQP